MERDGSPTEGAAKRDAGPQHDSARQLKRKKTVTWAEDDELELPLGPADDLGADAAAAAAADAPVVVLPCDGLFDALTDALLGKQVGAPAGPAGEEPLSRRQLLERRLAHTEQLSSLYEGELWALLEELRLRHSQFVESGRSMWKDAAQGGADAATAEQQQQQAPPLSAEDAAAAAAGEGEGEEEEAPGAALRQLWQRRRNEEEGGGRARGAAQDAQQPQKGGGQQAKGRKGGDGSGAAGQKQQKAAADKAGGRKAAGKEDGKAGRKGEQQEKEKEAQPPPKKRGRPPKEAAASAAAGKEPPAAKDAPQQAAAAAPGGQQQQQQQGADAPGDPAAAAAPPAALQPPLPPPPPLPRFEEVEALLLGGAAEGLPPVDQAALVRRRAAFVRRLELVGRLEQSSLAAACRELDALGGLGLLVGRRCRYVLRRACVALGRSSGSRGQVDVDLAHEGPEAAQRVSRHQALLFLEPDGGFRLRCTGRRGLAVNGARLGAGQTAALPTLSHIALAGGLSLLFVANIAASQRAAARFAPPP